MLPHLASAIRSQAAGSLAARVSQYNAAGLGLAAAGMAGVAAAAWQWLQGDVEGHTSATGGINSKPTHLNGLATSLTGAAGTMLLRATATSSLAATAALSASADAKGGKPAGALDPSEFRPFKVIDKQQLTHNTYRLR
jgi:hypothetical protein